MYQFAGATTVVFESNTGKEGTVEKQFPPICTSGTRNPTAIRTTANRARSGEFAVVPVRLGERIFAKISRGNQFWLTLTEPRAPQMTWLWNWSKVTIKDWICIR